MAYTIDRIITGDFNDVIDRVIAALKEEGFGVLTDIDVRATLANKLGVEFRPYRILGACNPSMAHQALQMESKIGAMLPCNVVVQQLPDGGVEVSAVDPVASLGRVGNAELGKVAGVVREKLERVIASLG